MAPRLLSLIGSVYNLDTLDTRFTTPSSVPYNARSTASADERKDKRDDGRQATTPTSPSRWDTLEFYFYYLVFLVAVPYMFWVAYDVSRRTSAPRTLFLRKVTLILCLPAP